MGNNEAPARIFAWCFQQSVTGEWGGWGGYARPENRRPLDKREQATGAEYLRLDLHTAAIAARDARIAALEAGLRDCVSAMTAEIFLYPKRKKRDPLLAAEQRARALLDGGKP